MNGKVALSIIIPVYNGERFIERALSSILSQPSNDYEIIVVNDGSTDNSLEVIEKFEKQYKNIRVINNTNHGVCYTRNVGIDHATGKYILFFDQDDVFFEQSYDLNLSERLHDYHLKNVDIFCFRYVKSNNTIQRFSTLETLPQSGQDNNVYMVSGLPTHFAMYNERLFHDKNLRFMESKYIDLDMQLTHLLFYYSEKIIYDNSLLLYCWVIHQNSEGHSSKNLEKKHYDAIKFWKKTSDIHYAEGDYNAQRYCDAWICGVFSSFLKEYYKYYLSSKRIDRMVKELEIDNILSNYTKIYHQETVQTIDKYNNNRLSFILSSRIEKIKRSLALFIIKKSNYALEKYTQKKYPLTKEQLKSELQS